MNASVPRWAVFTLGTAGAVAAGLAAVVNPVAAAAMMGVLAIVGLSFARLLPLRRLFLGSLGAVLIGYAYLGKGFAYVGLPPKLFVGELVLGAGLLALVVDGDVRRVFRSPIAWLLAAFAGWGALCTVPYLGTYGVVALRDAVVWGYAAFALCTASALIAGDRLAAATRFYARWSRWFVLWVPVAWAVYTFASASLPMAPGTEIPLLFFKYGDTAVHLAGAAALALVGFGTSNARATVPHRRVWEWAWWTIWLVDAAIIAASNRGGLLTLVAAFLVVVTLRPRTAWWKPALLGIVVAGALIAFDVSVDTGSQRRISARQVVENVQSIGGNANAEGDLDDNRRWRLNWWSDIVNYTFRGDYFWTGKGFGANLADQDGYQTPSGELRSPHNGHITMLARMGVPGLFLWVTLQGVFSLSLLRAFLRARRVGATQWMALNAWILAYWAAFLVNGAFDVFLEGPQGGVWFWCVVGLGIAALEGQRALASGAARPSSPWATTLGDERSVPAPSWSRTSAGWSR